MSGKLRLAAVIVTFHPEDDVRDRLIGYARFLSHVVVVDNSERSCSLAGLENIENLTYRPLRENRGIAAALNIGIEQVRSMGFAFALLLDQDSEALPRFVAAALDATADDIGIVAMTPVRPGGGDARDAPTAHAAIDVQAAITSGSILAMAAYTACGGFDERLFIDYVDTEYCLRLRRRGWRLVRVPSALLEHALGNPRQVRWLGQSTHYVSHAPFRSYYRVRNGLHVAGTHLFSFPLVSGSILKVLVKELVKAVFIEDARGPRLRYMWVGLRHWATGRFGPLTVA